MTDLGAEQKVVVIGAGQAGLAAAARLRALGYEGMITMVGEEPHYPYQRPPLSKAYVLGEMTRDRLFLRPKAFYVEQGIKVRTDTGVSGIDRKTKRVVLSDGTNLGYDSLVLATGSTPVRLPSNVSGDLEGVFYIRDLADADDIAAAMKPSKRVLIVGGGYIGLEGAAVAAKLGLHVTLVEAGSRILGRVASAETADYFRDLHLSHGVDLREGVGLTSLVGTAGAVQGANLSDGSQIECDIVLIGIGVRPNDNLAKDAGLVIENGIKTNARAQTSDLAIYAAGDCASFPWNDQHIRLESVGNAIDQGECVAANITGHGANYVPKPWFWSDQYDVKLQIAGLSTGFDRVIKRQTDAKSLSLWYFARGRLIAADAMNDPRGYMIAKRLIEAGQTPDIELLYDPATDLKSLLVR